MANIAEDQYEHDIQSVIKFLKQTDPVNATRQHAIGMLGNMQTLAHLIAHKVINKERAKSPKHHKTETSRPSK